jgi:CheY-like chemotaxis protein
LDPNLSIVQQENIQEDSLQGLQILVVDDDMVNQTVYKQNLLSLKALVTISNNGREALKMIEKNDFDLILMDLNMPIMGGIETTMKIRQLEGSKSEIPIIAITTDCNPHIKDEILKAGMNDFLIKHCDNKFLVEKIRLYLNID